MTTSFNWTNLFKHQATSGVILLLMTALAMLWANSPWYNGYNLFTSFALLPINDGLMAVFFLLVGLELKRGFVEGRLSRFSQISLPMFAAIGGMIVPASIFLLVNHQFPEFQKGWATPTATDIAFAIGVVSLFSKKIPRSLILFLLALAIFDDLGAILIISFFYTAKLHLLWVIAASGALSCLVLCNLYNIRNLNVYLILGALLWFSIFRSGIHPTLAGVMLAFCIPAEPLASTSPLHKLEHFIQPWVAFFIMPLFALANAGFALNGSDISLVINPLVLGIAAGLFVGKQIGVFCTAWLAIKMRIASIPKKATWLSLYGIAILCGIGFTMSLFLGTLSFQNAPQHLLEIRFGVLIGSILSGLYGSLILIQTSVPEE